MSYIVFCALVLVSSLASLGVVLRLSGCRDRETAVVCAAVGVGLAPFVAGIVVVATIGLLPGLEPKWHLLMTISVLLVGSATLRFGRGREGLELIGDWLRILRVGWPQLLACGCVVSLALATPLLQNDALEYMTISRVLFESRTLDVLPLADSSGNSHGAYLPWTHPPLYVALLYAGYAAQGTAQFPGVARLVAPWALIVGVWGVAALATRIGGRPAFFATLLFVLVPLYVLGSVSALADPLLVLAGSLPLCVLMFRGSWHLGRSALFGLVVGCVIWAHSVAVLILPMLAVILVAEWRLRVRSMSLEGALLLMVLALAVGFWPYLHNLSVMGVAISDSPPVMAMPEQRWSEYFHFMRGVETSASKIQYGVLKGWFSPEAYGLVFWFALLCPIFLLRRLRGGHRPGWNWVAAYQGEADLFRHLLMVGMYLGGVVLSVMAGSELLVRNERYMLLILAPVSLLAGHALDCVFSRTGLVWRLVHWGISGVLLLQGAMCFLQATSGGLERNREVPKRLQGVAVADALSSKSGGLVLTARPGDMYYSSRRNLSLIDPSLIHVYREVSVDAAMRRLSNLGVTHVYVPRYRLPPLLERPIREILSSGRHSRLVYEDRDVQLFELQFGMGEALNGDRQWVEPSGWRSVPQFVVGGRKAIGFVPMTWLTEGLIGPIGLNLPLGLFHRDLSEVAVGPPENWVGGESKWNAEICGVGAFRVWRRSYVRTADGLTPGVAQISTDGYVSPARECMEVSIRWLTPESGGIFGMEVEALGESQLSLRLGRDANPSSPLLKAGEL